MTAMTSMSDDKKTRNILLCHSNPRFSTDFQDGGGFDHSELAAKTTLAQHSGKCCPILPRDFLLKWFHCQEEKLCRWREFRGSMWISCRKQAISLVENWPRGQ